MAHSDLCDSQDQNTQTVILLLLETRHLSRVASHKLRHWKVLVRTLVDVLQRRRCWCKYDSERSNTDLPFTPKHVLHSCENRCLMLSMLRQCAHNHHSTPVILLLNAAVYITHVVVLDALESIIVGLQQPQVWKYWRSFEHSGSIRSPVISHASTP